MIRELLTPEAPSSPYIWSAVLLAHFAIGAMLWLLVGWWAVAIYAGFEVLQALVSRRAIVWDSILDWCAVVLGALVMGFAVGGGFALASACAGACLCIAVVGWASRS